MVQMDRLLRRSTCTCPTELESVGEADGAALHPDWVGVAVGVREALRVLTREPDELSEVGAHRPGGRLRSRAYLVIWRIRNVAMSIANKEPHPSQLYWLNTIRRESGDHDGVSPSVR